MQRKKNLQYSEGGTLITHNCPNTKPTGKIYKMTTYQEEVEITGDLYLVQSPVMDYDQSLEVYGVSNKPMTTLFPKENLKIETEALVVIEDPDNYFSIETPEDIKIFKLKAEIAELQAQLDALSK
jgi:putative aminopeptidase FrvX